MLLHTRCQAMCTRLQSTCRCVTGTPLSRGLEDLFGLLAFLQVRFGMLAWLDLSARCCKVIG